MKKFLSLLLIILSIEISAQLIIPSDIAVDAKAELGEGAFWNDQKQLLYWIDINGKKIFVYNPTTKINQSMDVPSNPGTVVAIDTGGMLVALRDGIYRADFEKQSLSLFVNSPEKEISTHRFNDGKCDPSGRLWVGTMGDKQKAALYRIDRDGSIHMMLDSITISNGIVWTADKKTMYYTDTPTRQIFAFDYNDSDGSISNKRTVITFPDGLGFPDGMSIDTNGMLWIAHWGGYCVGCWNPNTGKLIAKINVPAPNVTSCAFSGKNKDVLYITTARTGMTEEQKIQYPLSGGLFMAYPKTNGTKLNFFNAIK